MKLKIWCRCVVFTIFMMTLKSSISNACVTPVGGPGICIDVTSCPILYRYLKIKPIPENIRIFLQKSMCGYSKKTPKVCCPFLKKSLTRGYSLLPGYDVCGQNTQDRIFGGRQTQLGEFPWMALIEYTKPSGRSFQYGGALISSRYVLTAAHSIAGRTVPKTYKLVSVRLGEHDTSTNPDCTFDGECSDPPIDVQIESILVHEEFDPNYALPNDIALLRLARPVTFTDYIHSICLPRKVSVDKLVGRDLDIAGWGRTEKGSKSNVKLKVKVPVVNHSTCKTEFQKYNALITEKQICAGGNAGEDSCQGDSGGPLMGLEYSPNTRSANWYCIGIISFGGNCGTKGLPAVYTNVEEYILWISNNILP